MLCFALLERKENKGDTQRQHRPRSAVRAKQQREGGGLSVRLVSAKQHSQAAERDGKGPDDFSTQTVIQYLLSIRDSSF